MCWKTHSCAYMHSRSQPAGRPSRRRLYKHKATGTDRHWLLQYHRWVITHLNQPQSQEVTWQSLVIINQNGLDENWTRDLTIPRAMIYQPSHVCTWLCTNNEFLLTSLGQESFNKTKPGCPLKNKSNAHWNMCEHTYSRSRLLKTVCTCMLIGLRRVHNSNNDEGWFGWITKPTCLTDIKVSKNSIIARIAVLVFATTTTWLLPRTNESTTFFKHECSFLKTTFENLYH